MHWDPQHSAYVAAMEASERGEGPLSQAACAAREAAARVRAAGGSGAAQALAAGVFRAQAVRESGQVLENAPPHPELGASP